MNAEPDWLDTWTRLVDLQQRWRSQRPARDAWAGQASDYRARVRRKWKRPDSSRRLVTSWLKPGCTVLDIGAGSGSWTALFARSGARVTAVEPSPSMREVLASTLDEEGLEGVRVLPRAWPVEGVEPHDLVFCSHAMYSCRDFGAFVRGMVSACRNTCAMLIRVPVVDGPMAEVARLVLGHPNDSPNFVVAYNALLQMGIVANVQVEDVGPRAAWRHPSIEAALADVKVRMDLPDEPGPLDGPITEILERHLRRTVGGHCQPSSVRSALVWWKVTPGDESRR